MLMKMCALSLSFQVVMANSLVITLASRKALVSTMHTTCHSQRHLNAIVAAFDTFIVIGGMQVTVGAGADLDKLPEMIPPSETCCNLLAAAPATCMLLQVFISNPP